MRIEPAGFGHLVLKSATVFWVILSNLVLFKLAPVVHAETNNKSNAPSPMGSAESGAGTVLPDLFTGTMSYEIPIDVPSGRNGMEPRIALTYQSSNGNGWVGIGWELELGSIERGTRSGVSYDPLSTDFVFRMAGAAIDLVDYGNGEYRAKIEGAFVRIKKLTAADGKPYWEATTKVGTKYLFGQSTASRQDNPANSNEVFKWSLDRVEDTNGNFMRLYYTKDQGQIYLDRIDYAGNGTMAPTNYVKFYLEGRDDAPVLFTQNFAVKTAYRLKTIDIFSNGQYPSGVRVRKYELEYGPDLTYSASQYSARTGRSLLGVVRQYGKDGTTPLPPILLKWSQETTFNTGDWSTSPYTSIDNRADGHEAILPGDFNGDGKEDIIRARSGSTGWGNFWRVSLSNQLGFTTQDWLTGSYMPIDNFADGHEKALTGDFNGDGKSDIAHARTAWGAWRVSLSTGSGFTTQDWSTSPYVAIDNLSDQNEMIVTGDFNGDGKTDIAHARSGWTKWRVSLSTGSGFETQEWTAPAGRMVIHNLLDRHEEVLIGDFNGDGKTDIANARSQWGSWQVLLSTGSGWTAQDWAIGNGWWAIDNRADNNEEIIVGDFNGDGKTDIAHSRSLWSWWRVSLSTGSGLTTQDWSVSPNVAFDNRVINYDEVLVGDFSGDGKTDFARSQNGWTSWQISRDVAGPAPDLIVSISNGIGGTTTITYIPTPQAGTEQTLLPFPIQTVRSITVNDGNGVSATTTFGFSGGFYYIPEREFRGFHYAAITGPLGPDLEQQKRVIFFHQGNDTAVDANNPNVPIGFMKGKIYKIEVYVLRDGTGPLSSKVTTSYADDVDNLAPYFNPPLWVTHSVACNAGICNRSRIVYTYDHDYGNITQEQHIDWVTFKHMTIARSFSQNTSSWIVGLPIVETTYPSLPPLGTKAAETTFYYDGVSDCMTPSTNQNPTKGNITRVVRLSAWTIPNPETRMAYDAFGNVICGRDPNANVFGYSPSTFSYDSTFTFLKSVTNPLGQQTTRTYYGVDGVAADAGLYGQIKTIADPNGGVTIRQYDIFGRQISEAASDGPTTTISYNNFNSVGSQNIQTTAGGLSTSLYFDGSGRTIIERKTGPDGKTIAIQKSYSTTGTVRSASLPYFEGTETPVWTTLAYDPLGRPLQISNPDGSRTLSCYTNDSVTVFIDANNHRKRKTRDAYGRLIKVEEYQGLYPTCDTAMGTPYTTTTYEYDVLNHLLTVVDAKGNRTEMDYYPPGTKNYMRDPDLGSWGYSYDWNGNLTRQTSGKGQQTEYTYDALNRIKTEDLDVVFSDYFNRTTGLGIDWRVYYGTFNTDGDSAVSAQTSGGAWAGANQSLETDDYAVESLIAAPAGTANLGIVARGNPADVSTDGYVAQLALTNNTIRLYRRKASSWTLLQSVAAPGGLVGGQFYSLKLRVEGTNPVYVNVYFQGSSVISYTDTSTSRILSGIPGIVNYNPGVKYDNFRAYNNSSTTKVTHNYDEPASTNGIGRLTSISDPSGSTRFHYDKMGRITRTDKVVDGTTYTTQIAYDSLGRITSIGYPDGTFINYAYNGPFLSRVYEGTTNYAQYTGYNALGQGARVTFGNGALTDYSYSNSGNANCPQHNFRLCKITTSLSTTTYQNLQYGYDPVGNITSIIDPINGNQSFGYDDLNRLLSAIGPYGTISYTYDQIGNMTYNSQVGNYTYPPSGTGSVRPHAAIAAGANSYTYDQNGNIVQGAGRSITYNPWNRPARATSGATTTAFVYDGEGERVKKTVGATTTIYIGKLYECTSGICSKYIFAAGQRIALKPVGTTEEIYYYHPDHLGSAQAVTNAAGAKVENLAYYPYGQTRMNTGSVNVNHKYTAQELDDSTGLYFYNARYYDPELGRFIQPDTIVPDPTNPQAFNRYSYVINNPINLIDPSGHSFKKWWKRTMDSVRNHSEAVGFVLQNLHAAGGFLPGTYLLSRTETGRNVLYVEAAIAAIALGYGGYTAPVGGESAMYAGMTSDITLYQTSSVGGIALSDAAANTILASAGIYGLVEGVTGLVGSRNDRGGNGHQGSRGSGGGSSVPATPVFLPPCGTNCPPGFDPTGGYGPGALGTFNIGGGTATVKTLLQGALRWLGSHRQIDEGVFRSLEVVNGVYRQFRITKGCLDGKCGGVLKGTPHAVFEVVKPDGRTIIESSHVIIIGQ